MISKQKAQKYIEECNSKTEFAKKLGYSYYGGKSAKKVNRIFEEYDLDPSNFDRGKKNRKYEKVKKECPVCGEYFETKIGSSNERQTCSYSCSNKYFRSGPDNGNWNEESYRSTCFHHHEKKCIICGEEKIVEVHHADGDNENNSPKNLVPLCPTHHQYVHSRFSDLVQNQIEEYIQKFKNNNV